MIFSLSLQSILLIRECKVIMDSQIAIVNKVFWQNYSTIKQIYWQKNSFL